VGNGKNIFFWDDVWVGNEDLKSRFLRLFSLSISKDANIESFGNWDNDSWKWDIVWRRGLFNWKKVQEC